MKYLWVLGANVPLDNTYSVSLPSIKSKFMHSADTFYAWNLEIHAEKQPEGPYKSDKQYNVS